jgi:hypothetical protein
MFILYQIANEQTCIKSSDGCAWLRVIGFFNSKENALRHTTKLEPMEIRIAPVNTWRVVLNEPAQTLDNAELMKTLEVAHFDSMMDIFHKSVDESHARVQDAVDNRKPGALDESVCFSVDTGHKDIGASSVPDVITLAGQNVCVVSLVPDVHNMSHMQHKLQNLLREGEEAFKARIAERNTQFHYTGALEDKLDKVEFLQSWSKTKDTSEIPGDQPLVRFMGVFETDADAKSFCDTLDRDYTHVCITVGHFVRLRDVAHVNTKRYYDNPKLQTLMDALSKAKKQHNGS